MTVCGLSGLLPTPLCPSTRVDWFIDGTEPTAPDNVYQQFILDRATNSLATAQTPPSRQYTKVFAVLPQEVRTWAIKHGFPQPPTNSGSSSSPNTQTSGGSAVLRLLAPDPYTIFQITSVLPADAQQIRLSVTVPEGTTKITYQIDDQVVGSVDHAPWDVWWTLTPGAHQVIAVATLTDGSTQNSAPIPFHVSTYVPPEGRPDADATAAP
jgi:membrane carboxypeptidase/penicillin-binding protein PbpC